jgi:TolB protein
MPVFSPDGKHVAFASNRSGNWDIYLTDLDGSQPVQLTSDPTDEIHPSFSPDGSKLVYCSYGRQSGQWEMVVIDVDNPARKRFIGFGLFPEWSPQGDKILFQRARQRGTRWFSVWTLDYQDGEGVRPTEVAASANAGAITPRWSADGQHIVFCTVLNPDQIEAAAAPQADVWLMAADGSDRVNLTRNQFANTQPIWSPDGSIYFVSNRGVAETQNIWALKPDAAMRVAADAGRSKPAVREAAGTQPPSIGTAVMAGEDAP